MSGLLSWSIYEISSEESSLNGVMLRGRIRKFGLENNINVIAENTEDIENSVRYATLTQDDGERIGRYVGSLIGDVAIRLVSEGVTNPVLSKLKVNNEERYVL